MRRRTSDQALLSIEAAAEEAPQCPALLTEEGTFRFIDVAERVQALRAALRRDRPLLRPGDGLPILGKPTVDTVCTVYAALEEGLCLIPVHPRWTTGERTDFLHRLGLGEVWSPSIAEAVPTQPRGAPAAELALAILPTSGSTGRPKGVRLSRGAFLASAHAAADRLGRSDDDIGLLSLPLAHVGGLSILTRHLIARRPVVLPSWSGGFRSTTVLDTVRHFGVTALSVVPTMLRRLLAEGDVPPPSLRYVLVGGAAAPASLMAEAKKRGWPVLATYGLTEACSQVATQRPGSLATTENGFVGPLLDGIEARIQEGVLELRGPSLLTSYEPAGETGTAKDREGWFRTGDLARLGEKGLYILGRADHVIISGGENVSPLEVELTLENHPSVSMAAVFPKPDDEWGQSVHALVVLESEIEAKPSESELIDFARSALARFKAPRSIRIVESLATTASGKLDRRLLSKLSGV